jgi:hypothetical protein
MKINMYKKIPKKYLKKIENPNYNLHNFELPFRAVCVAPSGSGKTNFVINFISLCSKGKGTFETINIVTRNKDEPLYNWLAEVSNRIQISEGIHTIPKLDSFDKESNHLMVFDDLILEKNQDAISNYFIRARKLNVSCLYLSQKFYSIPKMIRSNCNYLVILKIGSVRDENLILHDYALGIEKDVLQKMYSYATREKFNTLIINLDEADIQKKFRKNFLEYLKPDEF